MYAQMSPKICLYKRDPTERMMPKVSKNPRKKDQANPRYVFILYK